MARGKQVDNEKIYKIMSSYFYTNNFSETAKQFNLNETTIRTIYRNNKDKPEFLKLRSEKQKDFAETATRLIEKATNRIEESLDNKKESIPLNQLSTTLGVLYDKRALARGESTENTKVSIEIDVIE